MPWSVKGYGIGWKCWPQIYGTAERSYTTVYFNSPGKRGTGFCIVKWTAIYTDFSFSIASLASIHSSFIMVHLWDSYHHYTLDRPRGLCFFQDINFCSLQSWGSSSKHFPPRPVRLFSNWFKNITKTPPPLFVLEPLLFPEVIVAQLISPGRVVMVGFTTISTLRPPPSIRGHELSVWRCAISSYTAK